MLLELETLAASKARYEAVRSNDEPWLGAARLVCGLEGIDPTGPLRRAKRGNAPAVIVPADSVVKFYGPWRNSPRHHDTEGRNLALMSRDPTLPVPRELGAGSLSTQWRYRVISLVSGSPLQDVPERDRPADGTDLARWLGGLVRRLHAVPLSDSEREAGWQLTKSKIRARYEKASQSLSDGDRLPAHLIRQIPGWLPPLDELIGSPTEAVLTHSDLTPSHIMGSPMGSQFKPLGVIDFGSSGIAHPLYDLGPIWWCTLRADRRLLEIFLAEARLDDIAGPAFSKIALAWAIVNPKQAHPPLPDAASVATLDELATRCFGPF